jgi:hypothetical protein
MLGYDGNATWSEVSTMEQVHKHVDLNYRYFNSFVISKMTFCYRKKGAGPYGYDCPSRVSARELNQPLVSFCTSHL